MDKPQVQLSGEDGNVYLIIGRVSKALKRNEQSEKATEFRQKALNAQSYDEVLSLAEEYCEIG